MLISRHWLAELFGDVAGLDVDGLADALTRLGLEVEGKHEWGQGLESLVVAEVRQSSPHPHADKLNLVQVHDGKNLHSVVCGAANVPAPGGKVVLAPVGTSLPGGLTLEAREIRGVRSEGMLCSEAELNIGPDSSGILVLPPEWTRGKRLIEYVPGIVDTVLEVLVTPNRPDALGHVGVARDLAVFLRRPFVLPEASLPDAPRVESELVELEAGERCGRYLGLAFSGVRVAPSPLAMRVRLHHLGLRPINNVVDITNFVLFEYGQPLHAFDRERLEQGRVVVRMASGGETLRTLDGRTLELAQDDLVIADARAPQALAGVMGGMPSAVQPETTSLLLEVAWFAPSGVRRTARRHSIHSDSSHRFERGVDHGPGLRRAALRASALLQSLTGARLDGWNECDGLLPSQSSIRFRGTRLKKILGLDVAETDIRRIFKGLEIIRENGTGESWTCLPPTHRPDLQREEDLIEEVMRHVGLEHIPASPVPPSRVTAPSGPDSAAQLRERLVDGLLGAGLHEHISQIFASRDELAVIANEIPVERGVRLVNPLRQQHDHLRTHMLPGLLRALALNTARHGRPVRLFEVGRVYMWPEASRPPGKGPTAAIDAQLPDEKLRAAILLGQSTRAHERPRDGRDMGGLLLHLLRKMGYSTDLLPVDSSPPADYLHPGVQGVVAVRADDGARVVGRFGLVHPDILAHWDLADTNAVYGEIHGEALPMARIGRFEPLPRFPATSRDVSLAVPVKMPASVIMDALYEAAAAERMNRSREEGVELGQGDTGEHAIDLMEDYRGDRVEADAKALLFRLHYRARERSVTDAEVDAFHEAVVSRARTALANASTGRPIVRR